MDSCGSARTHYLCLFLFFSYISNRGFLVFLYLKPKQRLLKIERRCKGTTIVLYNKAQNHRSSSNSSLKNYRCVFLGIYTDCDVIKQYFRGSFCTFHPVNLLNRPASSKILPLLPHRWIQSHPEALLDASN